MSTAYPRYHAEQVCDLLLSCAKAGKRLLLLCHVNPDGDAVGSAFALKKIYTLLGGEAACACTSDSSKRSIKRSFASL